MARSVNEIQESILAAKNSAESLSALEVLTDNEKNTIANLTSTSKVAQWRLWVYIQSVAVWALEKLFDINMADLEAKIAEGQIHNFAWYIKEAKAFQFGFSLNNLGVYDNTGITENLLIQSRIISQVAIEQLASKLQIKVVKTDVNGNFVKLTSTEVSAFSRYMEERKDAGTRLIIFSRDADEIRVELDIYYDPQVLTSVGDRLDGTQDKPVVNAIKDFTKQLEFNGELILQKLVDSLQSIDGVKIVDLKVVEAKFGANPYAPVSVRYLPDSGHFLFDELSSVITFIDNNV